MKDDLRVQLEINSIYNRDVDHFPLESLLSNKLKDHICSNDDARVV